MPQRLPRYLLGLGVLFGGLMVAELLVAAVFSVPFDVAAWANFVTSIPFVIVLLYGGYWLSQDRLDPNRYPRIAKWTGGGMAFIGAFFGIIAVTTQTVLITQVGIVRWGLVAGAGAGALVGLYEARAISRAVEAERTKIRYEELQRQNERLGEVMDILSHDLRNPLNVAQGRLELLDDTAGDEHVDQIAAAHDRMYEIIEDMLELARSGQIDVDPEPVDLAELVRQCWSNVDTKAATLILDAGPTQIHADSSRVQNLFENLFRNAVEHGGPDVTITVGRLPEGFFVEDDGPGIPQAEQADVFESGYSSKTQSTGFGLAIVDQIATTHGWTVTLTTGPDGGARFEFTGVELHEVAAAASTRSDPSGNAVT